MRITKKFLREQKRALTYRITELCSIGVKGTISDEFFRVFPSAVGNIPTDYTDWHKMRQLLADSVERAFPSHLTDG